MGRFCEWRTKQAGKGNVPDTATECSIQRWIVGAADNLQFMKRLFLNIYSAV
jgi:hypothetical protein